jgi:hypothetical protein
MFILVPEDDMAWMDMGYGTMNEWGYAGSKKK